MKRKIFFISLTILATGTISFIDSTESPAPVSIPAEAQRSGDPVKGYEYLTTGDFIKSGVPYSYYVMLNGKKSNNYLDRTGKNATVDQGYNVVTAPNGTEIVIPTCLQCHSHVFDGKLVIGLGNNSLDFSNTSNYTVSSAGVKMMQVSTPQKYEAFKTFYESFKATYPNLETEVRGVNTADKLAAILVAHRDPQTLAWSDEPMIDVPKEVIPTDVPAWWMLKKKNAMFYNGFGRGDFSKFLMLSNILTVKDTAEAREVHSHFGDVLAYIRSLDPPEYPATIDNGVAAKGRVVFNDNCSRCHGTYGTDGSYPNLLVPEGLIGTDSMLYKANQQDKRFIDWFNKSWFAQGENAARLEPADGYVAPPLDGVWITAPYFHNGSVPTIEAVLNSELRPRYWSRDFDKHDYDYQNLGLIYKNHDNPIPKKTYNTDLPGYGNYGHYFGDGLSEDERKEVIEYLKTL